MEITLLLCGLAVGVLACTWVAQRLDVPAPFLLIAVGIAASYVPDDPGHRALRGHRAVRAAAAAACTPPRRARRSSTSGPTGGRSCCCRSGWSRSRRSASAGSRTLLLPGISWPIAFAIGAVVAPPDAVAATAIGRRIGLPRRIVTILEGESLLNDATALVALGTALAVADGEGLNVGRGRPRLPHRGRRWRPRRLRLLPGRREGPAPPRGPRARQRAVAGGPVRGVRRGRAGARLRRHRGRGRRPAAGPQGADPADRPVPDRGAAELAHDRVRPRERRLPADRAAGQLDRPGRR